MVVNAETVSSFSEACPEVAGKIRNLLTRDVVFEDGMGKFTTMAKYSQTLPSESPLENDKNIVDIKMKMELMGCEAMNWWTSPCPHYHPLHVHGSKNVSGLCDAVSMAIWGIEDYSIKNIMKKTLANDATNKNKIFNYFENMPNEYRGVNWGTLVRAVDNDNLSIQHFHIFLVCNIIKRPIIVLGNDGPCGIYLPVLCQVSKTSNSPLVLGYQAGFSPLIPSQPDMGRDFIPICKATEEIWEVHCLTKDQVFASEALIRKYLDVQHHNVKVSRGLLDIPVARLNLMSLSADLCIIDNYFDGINACLDNVESFVLLNRWSQISTGLAPDDWALPKQAAIYNYSYRSASMNQEYPDPAPQNTQLETGSENFFQRPTVELSSKLDEPKKMETGISQKRALFKRRLTLSDLNQGFGKMSGTRVLGGEVDVNGQNKSAVRRIGPVAGRPGLVRPIRKASIPFLTTETVPETEEEDGGEVRDLVRRLSTSYRTQDQAEAPQHIGFVPDRSTIRAKKTISRRISDLISPC